MKPTIITFILVLMIANVFGQEPIADSNKLVQDKTISYKKDTMHNKKLLNNSIYLEALGNAPWYSLNYERIIFSNTRFHLSGRIGFGYAFYKYDRGRSHNSEIGIPVVINSGYLLRKDFFIEVGMGVAYRYENLIYYIPNTGKTGISKSHLFACTAIAGLRVLSNKGFLFRVGFTPIYFIKNSIFLPLGGISLGYSF